MTAQGLIDAVMHGINAKLSEWHIALYLGTKSPADLKKRLQLLADLVMYPDRMAGGQRMKIMSMWHNGLSADAKAMAYMRCTRLGKLPDDVMINIIKRM